MTITGAPDGLVDGTQTVTLTASANGHSDGTDTLDVADDDTPALSVVIAAASINENGGTTTATVTRNTDTTNALTVTLISDDTGEATVPVSVTIAAGEASSAPLTITGAPDGLVDGTQTVTLTASASGHSDGTDTLDIADDDTPALSVVIAAASINENGGTTTATVTRNTDTANALTVTLISDDTGEATVPVSVTLPAGEASSAPFTISGAPDGLVDGTQTVTLTASATGHSDGTDTLDVANDDVLLDFGDAPTLAQSGFISDYPVTLAQNGARHTAGTLFLGQGVSLELDGQPGANADTDSEDDGVTKPILLIASNDLQTRGFLDVVASDAGILQAWIDFNQDGDWSDPQEQIASDVSVDSGTHRITFSIPVGAVVGTTFARFRISTQTSLGVVGLASDGEVEDHSIELLDAAVPHDLTFQLVNDSLDVIADTERIVIGEDGVPQWSAPASAIAQFDIQGSESDQVIKLSLLDSDATSPTGLHFDGGSGIDTFILVTGTEWIDMTSTGRLQIENFERLDLQDQISNRIRIDVDSFTNESGANPMRLIGDEGDEIELVDPEQWRLGTTRVENGRFFQSLTTAAGDPVIEVSLPNAWHNRIRPSDVNNDLQVTALDALVIINELARRAYSDDSTGELVSPEVLAPWPGIYYDRDKNGSITALDALRIINDLARNSSRGEGEDLPALPTIASQNSPADRSVTRPEVLDQALGEWRIDSQDSPKIANFELRSESWRSESHVNRDEGLPVSKISKSIDLIAEELANLLTHRI